MGEAGVVDQHEQAARAHARMASLHYVDHDMPGITRHRAGKGFFYRDPTGERITDGDEIARLKRLAIPPAYQDVWICADPDGHLQAVGRDARGRWQYRYHPRWRAVRDENKFERMLVFSEKLPEIRRRIDQDLRQSALSRTRVIAAVVRLMERTMARIGNDEYAQTNKSYGLTTLRHRHAKIRRHHLTLDFRAKHGIRAHVEIDDPRLARVIGRLEDLPGQRLFRFVDDDGALHDVHSHDVNDYLRDITQADITAKDFRTWAATKLAAMALTAFETVDTKARARKNLLRAIEHVAAQLGNTPSVCRKCYIHPGVLDGYLDGTLREAFAARADAVLDGTDDFALTAQEAAITAYLAHRLRK
ncbi:DNA topoisomerase I [Neoasaia chiangmaiensis NBRC 101099]|uniref:DNA topoisomerase n=1 Tax=Neoasaia chiangmaiensis TaxID=320497 RepID=A0A1U9KNR6_9PROT|nr:DNA topoisomerase IB [Neoasaia chiangmaiensis]AQS87436.1 DNA topoisomerase I [Neoasaia chiangmaiensis]GBR42728.1 DNA topoisomerase I [Neoasaia chiangmaiensis NBRC 101099]GEN16212.1 DNA topoisomerase [Neoasaia chiangmaiensis]